MFPLDIGVTNGGVGIFDPGGDTYFEPLPGRGTPIKFSQGLRRDHGRSVRQITAPPRTRKGYLGSRFRFKTF